MNRGSAMTCVYCGEVFEGDDQVELEAVFRAHQIAELAIDGECDIVVDYIDGVRQTPRQIKRQKGPTAPLPLFPEGA